MDDLVQTLFWLLPLLFGLLSWASLRIRESKWWQEFAQRSGIRRREYEQEWEYQRRVGLFWLSVATIAGVVAYQIGQLLLEQAFDPSSWEFIGFSVCFIVFVWSATMSIRSLWASRRVQ